MSANKYLEVLTPQNSQIIFIDQQPQMAFGVQSIDRQTLKNNVVGLAKAARAFNIPTTITTVETDGFSGNTFPELLAVFPDHKILERTSMNSWDDQNVRDALAANGRKKIVVAGLWTEVCNTTFALCAMLEGDYEIYMVADASGGTSADAHKYAMDRMIQAGVVPVTWQQVMLEWQRDWARKETYDAVTGIAKEHSGAYGMGIDYAVTHVHKLAERVTHGERIGPNPAPASKPPAGLAVAPPPPARRDSEHRRRRDERPWRPQTIQERSMPHGNTPNPAGSFAPLRQPVFAVLWAATVLGNVGSFMRDVASSWLVTDLSASPTAVALIQTAATLPIFLLAIPAGVLSDILDRRRFLIFVQLLLASVSGTLLSHTGALTVDYLIALTFVGGIGAALMGPTWQSIVPELVPRADLKGAVALNSLGINIARAIGRRRRPDPGQFRRGRDLRHGRAQLCVRDRRPVVVEAPAADSTLSENFLGAFRAGLRYTRASKLHRVLLRRRVLPVRQRRVGLAAAGGAPDAGRILGLLRRAAGRGGRGAILGALLLPRLGKLDADGLVLLASVASAAVMAALVFAPPVAGRAAAGRAGHGLDHGAHHLQQRGPGHPAQLGARPWPGGVPDRVQRRHGGRQPGLGPGGARNRRALRAGGQRRRPGPGRAAVSPRPLAGGRGRLAGVEPLARAAGCRAGGARSRPGAGAGGVPHPSGRPPRRHEAPVAGAPARWRLCLGRGRAYGRRGAVVEWFFVESWAEHLRQHHRVSHADADLQAEALRFHVGPDKPEVHHFLALKH